MKKIFKWVLRIILGILVFVILFAAGTFGYLSIQTRQKEKLADQKMTGTAEVIEQDGLAFRDLNKNGWVDPYEDFRVTVEERVEDLLSRMNLVEKAGMMLHPFLFSVDTALNIRGSGLLKYFFSPEDIILNREIRHVTSSLGTADPAVHVRWHNRIQKLAEESRLGIPVTVSSDPRHSVRSGANISMEAFSKWPDPIGFAAIGDSLTVVDFGRMAAREYRAVGIQTALHPMADLATEPRWARISGTFGEDARLSAKLTAAYLSGFQGDSLTEESVTCMTKHFPGGGPQEDGWDPHFKYGMNQVYPGTNFDYHLIPFRSAIRANTAQMMPYYGLPAGTGMEEVGFAFNREIIHDLLQEEMGFEGVVCSDWGIITPMKFLGITIARATDHGVEKLTNTEKVEKALNAGIDQFGGEYEPRYIIRLVNEGRIPESRIDASVRKLLRLKFLLGLFENPYVDEEEADRICNNREFRQAGKEAMLRSMVLLTNKGGDRTFLPLKKRTRFYVLGIDREAAGIHAEVVDELAEADAVLMRLSAPYEVRGGFLEGIFHQGSLAFSPDSLASILTILQQKPTVVAMYMDRPAVIPEIAAEASAVIAHFGTSDEALLEMVFGLSRPTGKLPFQMPSSMESVKNQQEDVPFDLEYPLFPFGHGLTYPLTEDPSIP
ncbi:MAG: glycoside hydrolase family 3 N-terminal domain-containing protein [Bacteroidales bacterium]